MQTRAKIALPLRAALFGGCFAFAICACGLAAAQSSAGAQSDQTSGNAKSERTVDELKSMALASTGELSADDASTSSEPEFLPISRIDALLQDSPIAWMNSARELQALSAEAGAPLNNYPLPPDEAKIEMTAPAPPDLTAINDSATTKSANRRASKMEKQSIPVPPPMKQSRAIRDGKVWINDATIDDLMSGLDLDYERARSVYYFRRIHGPFLSHHALKQVHGVSEAQMLALREKIVIAPPSSDAK